VTIGEGLDFLFDAENIRTLAHIAEIHGG